MTQNPLREEVQGKGATVEPQGRVAEIKKPRARKISEWLGRRIRCTGEETVAFRENAGR